MTNQPLTEPPVDLMRIANAVGIKEGETFTLAKVANLVEAMAMDLARLKQPMVDADETIARLRALQDD